MRQYIFGSGQLYVTDTSGNNPIKFGVLQDVNVEFSGDMKMLNGQFGYPVAVGRGKQKVSIKANNGDFDPNLYAATYMGDTPTVGSYAQAVDELGTPNAAVSSISSTSITQVGGIATATFATAHGFTVDQPLTVTGAVPVGYNVAGEAVLSVPSPTTLTYAVPVGTTTPAGTQGAFVGAAAELEAANAGFYRDLGVVYAATGVRLKQIPSGTPAQGQYTVNSTTGLYTFNVADEGTAVKLNYIYKNATAGWTMTMNNHLIGTEPTFQLIMAETFESQWFFLQFNQVKCGKLGQPLKLDDFSLSDLEFDCFVDSAGVLGIWSSSVGEPL